MQTYKFGNKVTAILRSCFTDKIGKTELQYANQPYTILNDAECELSFTNQEVKSTVGNKNFLTYDFNKVSSLTIRNIPLTEKIINLIFTNSADIRPGSGIENVMSDEDGFIYLNPPTDEIYQVFIYNDNGELETALDAASDEPIAVQNANSSYLVCYNFVGTTTLLLNQPSHCYLSIDLIVKGNIEDQTSTIYIHLNKCAVKINNTMYFANSSNAVDLTFDVIASDDDYLTI